MNTRSQRSRLSSRGKAAAVCAALVLCLAGAAWAHRPIPNDGSHTGPRTAIFIPDPDVSQVAYHQVTAESPQLWIALKAKAGQSLYVQIGVPQLESLQDYRPAVAILGPGLPPVDTPLAIPEGYGGWAFPTENITPEAFYEPFTGTSSWMFPSHEVTVPRDGRYYITTWVPGDTPGKFWVALGRRESFSPSDIAWLPLIALAVRDFHEVFPFGGLILWAFPILLIILASPVALIIWMLRRRLKSRGANNS